ncbi:hypothetical protein VaNZ11_007907 [Volvox africanus]|uniref:Flavin-containing monooxygenase n=1 Tax=Volvox africanus TaxID=51714 RepID=A0ABQ5S3Z4_9CHLO|nr:hypothetical protein VaNZ11_007907 [Volvox africanus]
MVATAGASHMRQRLASGLLRTQPRRSISLKVAVCSMPIHPTSGSALRSLRVVVIGAGAAGLAAARELRSEGHDVTVLEQSPYVGGVWRYDPRTESEDLLGINSDRSRVHSSMYEQLRTNLPRELMSFIDFPFDSSLLGPQYSSDPRRFCSHTEVLGYLNAFADFFNLRPLVRTHTRVLSVEMADEAAAGMATGGAVRQAPSPPIQVTMATTTSSESLFGFVVTSERLGTPHHDKDSRGDSPAFDTGTRGGRRSLTAAPAAIEKEFYDAVVVCNGHYSEPRLPHVSGMFGESGAGAGGVQVSDAKGVFPGQQMHSHNYRCAKEWRGKVVLVVGASNSGEDITRELSAAGVRRVLLSAWSWKNDAWGTDTAPYGPGGNIYRYPMVSELHADGSATFTDGRREGPIDAVIYCTGYRYSFPFLRGAAAEVARVEDNCVGPLWLHMLPPGPLAPGLSFVGLPWKVVPFPQFQLQSKLIARLLSGRVQLPRRKQMEEDIEAHFEAMRAQQLPKRYAHMQGQQQFAYNDMLAKLCGPDVVPLPWWRAELNRLTGLCKRDRPDDYRNVELATISSDAAAALAAASADISSQVELLKGIRGGSEVANAAHGAEKATKDSSSTDSGPKKSSF